MNQVQFFKKCVSQLGKEFRGGDGHFLKIEKVKRVEEKKREIKEIKDINVTI